MYLSVTGYILVNFRKVSPRVKFNVHRVDVMWCGVWSKRRQTKTATVCPDQNGDKPKRWWEHCVERSV